MRKQVKEVAFQDLGSILSKQFIHTTVNPKQKEKL